ncbi:MAG: hypothetical protein GYA15_11180 [Leptolinea sp.]|jgi:hypothetical protein|nr:hypothetical protein [Leptolinea sp.]
MPEIIVNGKVYTNPDDVPPEVRAAYQKALEMLHDSDKNGIPDFLEGKPGVNVSESPVTVVLPQQKQFVVDGKVYTNAEQMPRHVKLKYEQAMARLGLLYTDAVREKAPPVLKRRHTRAVEEPAARDDFDVIETMTPIMTSQEPPPSVIQEDTSSSRTLLIMLVAVLVMAAIGLILYFFVW